MAMPRLSETLGGPRHPERCQSCGAGPSARLVRWRECDERDRPGAIVVVLCRACGEAIVEPHPRLYCYLEEHEPWPGAMPLCVDCRHREGVRCRSGELLSLTYPEPRRAHVLLGRPRRGLWLLLYPGPVTACSGREEVASAHST